MTKLSTSILLCSSAFLLASSIEATVFTFETMECNTGAVSLSDVTASCETTTGGCEGGDTVVGSGNAVLNRALPSSYTTLIKLCKYHTFNYNWMCVYRTEIASLDICGRSNAVESNGLECGYPGTYTFSINEQLPSFNVDVGSGYKIYAEAKIVDDSDDSTYEWCTLVFDTDESSVDESAAASLVWTWSAVGAALLVLGGAVYRKRRVRGRALLDATDAAVDNAMASEKRNKPSKAPFVEMSDRGLVV
ncbi:hypothetical protein ACA910_020362 [Epithemia clementina (nom. ined.)]